MLNKTTAWRWVGSLRLTKAWWGLDAVVTYWRLVVDLRRKNSSCSKRTAGEAENVNQSYLNRGDRMSSTLPGVQLVYVTLQDECFEMHIGKTQRNLNLNFLKNKIRIKKYIYTQNRYSRMWYCGMLYIYIFNTLLSCSLWHFLIFLTHFEKSPSLHNRACAKLIWGLRTKRVWRFTANPFQKFNLVIRGHPVEQSPNNRTSDSHLYLQRGDKLWQI